MSARAPNGQAAVETALTLPLALFMVLGALQLFLVLNGRMMAQYAAYKAARAGSVSEGKCTRMRHAAIAALLPTFTRSDDENTLALGFGLRQNNRFDPAADQGFTEEIVWIHRESPTLAELSKVSLLQTPDPRELVDHEWDDPDSDPSRMELEMVFWFPLKIPFANWVMARLVLAHFGLTPYTAVNPLQVTRTANWQAPAGGFTPRTEIADEMRARIIGARHYVMPIVVSSSMKMLTPARRDYFDGSRFDFWCRGN